MVFLQQPKEKKRWMDACVDSRCVTNVCDMEACSVSGRTRPIIPGVFFSAQSQSPTAPILHVRHDMILSTQGLTAGVLFSRLLYLLYVCMFQGATKCAPAENFGLSEGSANGANTSIHVTVGSATNLVSFPCDLMYKALPRFNLCWQRNPRCRIPSCDLLKSGRQVGASPTVSPTFCGPLAS